MYVCMCVCVYVTVKACQISSTEAVMVCAYIHACTSHTIEAKTYKKRKSCWSPRHQRNGPPHDLTANRIAAIQLSTNQIPFRLHTPQ